MTHPFTDHEQYDKTFKKLTLEEETVDGITFEDCTFQHCSFRQTLFQQCTFRDCLFQECDLSLIEVDRSIFSGVTFEQTKAIGINWTTADWKSSRFLRPTFTFTESDLSYATFIGLTLEKFTVTDSIAKEADFSEAKLTKASFTGTDLTQSRFNQSDLTAADFSNARNYTIDIATPSSKSDLHHARSYRPPTPLRHQNQAIALSKRTRKTSTFRPITKRPFSPTLSPHSSLPNLRKFNTDSISAANGKTVTYRLAFHGSDS